MHLAVQIASEEDQPSAESRTCTGRTIAVMVGVVLAILITFRCFFFVDETEYVYVTQFGAPVRLHVEPGLGVKWPYQSVWRFDRRLQMYEAPAREMLTEDKENLTVQWYVCWRLPTREFIESRMQADRKDSQAANAELVASVRRFLETVGTVESADLRLEERIQTALAAALGRTRLTNIVSMSPDQLQLATILDRTTAALRESAAQQFGIEIVDIRVVRFGYPDAVKPAVFAEIRSERERIAVQYRAEGASQKTKIESLASLQREQILSQARREALRLRGEGEAKAIEILNAAHARDPRFYELMKTLDAYRAILDDKTTVILSADSPLLRLLSKGIPTMTPAPATSPAPTESPTKAPTGSPAGTPNASPVAGGSP